MKTHRFEITVSTNLSRRAARNAILVAFAKRNPDGCSFSLLNPRTLSTEEAALIGSKCAFQHVEKFAATHRETAEKMLKTNYKHK